MGNRSRAREQAFQILYFMDLTGAIPGDAIQLFKANFETLEKDFEFSSAIVTGVSGARPELDVLIEKCSDNWRVSRMPRIDRNVLRLGAFELLRHLDVPISVAIDEAIELGKKYGEEKTSAFVNGILDRISKQVRTGV